MLPAETLIETRRPWDAPVLRATIEVPNGPILRVSDRYIPASTSAPVVTTVDTMVNGHFSGGISGGTVSYGGDGLVSWSPANGGQMLMSASLIGGPNVARATKTALATIGNRVRVRFTLVRNSGTMHVAIGSSTDGSEYVLTDKTASGTFEYEFIATTALVSVALYTGLDVAGDFAVDNIQVLADLTTDARTQHPESLALVAEWGTVVESLNPLDAGGAPATWDGFKLANTRRVAGFANIAALNEVYPLTGARVTLSRLGPTLARSGEITLGVFFVEDIQDLDDPLVTLRMSDVTLGFEDAATLPRITRDVLPFAPRASLNKVVPVPFGNLKRIPCVPIVDGAGSQLALAIDITQTSIPLDDIEVSDDFPESGTVLIHFELITYTGKSGRNLTGATRGAFSTLAAEHAEGEAVFEARDSYVLAVGLGEVAVSDIRVSGVSARTSPVASVDSNFFGVPITIITFPVTDMQAFHVIGAGGTFPLSPAELKVEDPATSQTRVIAPGFAFSAPNHRTANMTIPFSGGSPGGNVQRRLAGGVFTTIRTFTTPDLPLTFSDTADYISDGNDEIKLTITSGSGYDVHLQFNSYSIVIDSTGTSPSGGSTTAAVLGDVTCDVVGVTDDGLGTITGVGGTMLEIPADITRWIHTHLYGLTAADLGPRWAATRAAQAGAHLRWAFLLGFDGAVTYSDLRRKIGEQSRSRLLVDAGLLDLVWQPDLPSPDVRLDYERQIWDQMPATASKTSVTERKNRIIAEANRDYAEDRYRALATPDDLTQPGFTDAVEESVTFDFIQDLGTAEAMAQWRLRELKRQRWEVQLVAWQNVLAVQLGDTLSLDSHPNLSPDLVFRVLGKSYRIGDEQPSRIGLTAVEVPA